MYVYVYIYIYVYFTYTCNLYYNCDSQSFQPHYKLKIMDCGKFE